VVKLIIFKDTTETESEVAEKSSWAEGKKLGLVWRNGKKIINDYLYLPFFLLYIFRWEVNDSDVGRGAAQ
jgi:hypothetical protein